MSAPTSAEAITTPLSSSFSKGSRKTNHDATNSDMSPLRNSEEGHHNHKPKVKFLSQEPHGAGGRRGETNMAPRKIYRRVRDAFQRAPLKLESIRILKVKEITQPDGTKQHRITGARTGNENGLDIIDRTIPFSYKFAGVLTYLLKLPDAILYWSFTCKFWKFTLASIVLFYGLNLLFAFIILASAIYKPECLSPNIGDIDYGLALGDAFQLSWTTFSTVGYGLISPATIGHFDNLTDQSYCAGVNVLLSFESLIGVLFVGFCSAIIFGKLTRFQSNAKVMFSSVMLVRFGDALMEDNDDDDDADEIEKVNSESDTVTTFTMADTASTKEESRNMLPSQEENNPTHAVETHSNKASHIPCPILRFRIVNEMHSNRRGEIIDAEVNVVATVDAKNSILGIRSEKVFNDALTLSASTGGPRTQSIIKGSSALITGTIHSVSSNIKKQVSKTLPLVRTLTDSKKDSIGDRGAINFDNENSEKTATQTRAEKLEAMYQMRKSTLRLIPDHHDDIEEEEIVPETSNTDTANQRQPASSNEISLFRSALQRNQSVYFQTDVEKPNLVYAQVSVTPCRHPFFRSVWVISHTLNESSPLLKKRVRRSVTANNGFWPLSLNSIEGVQDSIHFDNLLISFKGHSSLSGTEVYDQHVYNMDDLKVGEQFRSLLMRNLDGSIFVNTNDIDETMTQEGGIPSSLSLSSTPNNAGKSSSLNRDTNRDGRDHDSDHDGEGVEKQMVMVDNIVDDIINGNEQYEKEGIVVGKENDRGKETESVGLVAFPVKLNRGQEDETSQRLYATVHEESNMVAGNSQEEVIDLGLPVKKKGWRNLRR